MVDKDYISKKWSQHETSPCVQNQRGVLWSPS